jgi:hypothetical protein
VFCELFLAVLYIFLCFGAFLSSSLLFWLVLPLFVLFIGVVAFSSSK